MNEPTDSPKTLGELGPKEGYALVEKLYDAGALSCMEYQERRIHDECVWHHKDKAEALVGPL